MQAHLLQQHHSRQVSRKVVSDQTQLISKRGSFTGLCCECISEFARETRNAAGEVIKPAFTPVASNSVKTCCAAGLCMKQDGMIYPTGHRLHMICADCQEPLHDGCAMNVSYCGVSPSASYDRERNPWVCWHCLSEHVTEVDGKYDPVTKKLLFPLPQNKVRPLHSDYPGGLPTNVDDTLYPRESPNVIYNPNVVLLKFCQDVIQREVLKSAALPLSAVMHCIADAWMGMLPLKDRSNHKRNGLIPALESELIQDISIVSMGAITRDKKPRQRVPFTWPPKDDVDLTGNFYCRDCNEFLFVTVEGHVAEVELSKALPIMGYIATVHSRLDHGRLSCFTRRKSFVDNANVYDEFPDESWFISLLFDGFHYNDSAEQFQKLLENNCCTFQYCRLSLQKQRNFVDAMKQDSTITNKELMRNNAHYFFFNMFYPMFALKPKKSKRRNVSRSPPPKKSKSDSNSNDDDDGSHLYGQIASQYDDGLRKDFTLFLQKLYGRSVYAHYNLFYQCNRYEGHQENTGMDTNPLLIEEVMQDMGLLTFAKTKRFDACMGRWRVKH